MGDPLGSEKEYLKANRERFMREYPGKYLLIKGDRVSGAFETYDEGVKEGARIISMAEKVQQPPRPFAGRALIDTGASTTCIDRAAADTAGLTVTDSGPIR